MAVVFISALIPLLVENLTSEALIRIARYRGIDAQIKKLHRSLTQIQDVLVDASQKEITRPSLKRWLNDLQHLSYEIDDVLDDLAIDAMEEEFATESEASGSEALSRKVRKLFSGFFTKFPKNTKMLDKLDSVNAKLQELLKEKADIGLSVIEEPMPRYNNENRIFQSSVVHQSIIVGRQTEKEELVQRLLKEDGPSHQNYVIVPIFGMGGVGKTTLARLVYDDQRVKDYFEPKGWVCISDDFDIFGRTKDIFKSVGGELNELEDFNKLQEALRDYVRGKRFLLVLDDVWCESYTDWETLVRPFYTCATGSKIIITTRKDQLFKQLKCDSQKQHLQSLSQEHALSLLALHALDESNFDSHLLLKPHAICIVKNCGGLPLALIALGRSLRTKKDEAEHWEKVSNSEIWRLNNVSGILPALRLSYHELSAPLKQVFAYCSLFPKDFLFDKEELVLLWMAEGFLHRSTQRDSTKERLGCEYFDELLSRSFFQSAPNNKSLFVMHDLINDLATHVAGEFFVRLDIEAKKGTKEAMLKKYYHMSFVREEYVTYKKLEVVKRAKSLRTFLATSVGVVYTWQNFYLSNKIVVDLLGELSLLRVLSLSKFEISEVPESIGTLRHLRYLNLSRTKIKDLPENISNLYNLETLILFGCWRLAKLPNNFSKLKNLRHLNIKGTMCLDHLPLGIGELKSLQTLSKIIIGGKSGFEITKLKDLEHLRGEVSIVGLEKVKNATDASVANLSQKRLSKLEVVWSETWDDSRNEMLEKDVLNELMPCNDKLLIKLIIRSYGGLEFPKWVGDPLFVHLKHVSLSGCKRCKSLPPLAQLKSLKELFIKNLDGVKAVGMELLGTSRAFPSLEVLSYIEMHGWEKWSISNGEDVFPCLERLVIEDCPNLVEVTLEKMHSLNVLELKKCDCDVLRRGVIDHLGAVEDLIIKFCDNIIYLWESEAVASKVLVNLRDLNVWCCDDLVSLEKKKYEDSNHQIASLRSLTVALCKNMERCSCPDSIMSLNVTFCSSLTSISFPKGGGGLKKLVIQYCDKLLKSEWGGQNNNNRMLLEDVEISDWPNPKSIINLYCLVHLSRLEIRNCEGLESLPDNVLPNLKSLKRLEIRDCPRMDGCFPRGLWPPNLQTLEIGRLKKPISEWGSQNFPTSLVDLTLYDGGEDGMSSCSQFSNLLPSSLTYLRLVDFEKLESFSMGVLQHLRRLSFKNCPNLHKLSHSQHITNSLQHLTFNKCPNMKDLPKQLLPTLLSLNIWTKCPNLEERCSKRGGSYWPLISHIPRIDISPVQNATHANVANFPQKRLSELEVVWSNVWNDSRKEMLEKDVRCASLPPLAQLKSLKELLIEGLDGVKAVGMEILGNFHAFSLLEILRFKYMCGWKQWSTNNAENVFPCLKQLVIEHCPNLVEVTLEAMLIEVASSVTELEIIGISVLNDVVWRGFIDHLRAVEDLTIRNCSKIRYLWESEAVASKVLVNLRYLKVSGCDNLEQEEGLSHLKFGILEKELGVQNNNNNRSSMPLLLEYVYIIKWPNLKSIINLNCLINLTRLKITNCEGLESLPDNEFPNLTSLKHIEIEDYPRMDGCFPRGLWPPNLYYLRIGRLKKPISKWGSQNFPTSLVQLRLHSGGDEYREMISSCQFSNLLPSSLTSLLIVGFEKLESFSMGLQHLQSITFGNCPNLHKLSHPQHINNSLQHLFFDQCPNMKDLPEQLLPSLLRLCIWCNCSNLKERCSKGGSYWPLVSHIPLIFISDPELRILEMSAQGGNRRQSHRQTAARGNGEEGRDPRDIEIERLQQRIRELEINPFNRLGCDGNHSTRELPAFKHQALCRLRLRYDPLNKQLECLSYDDALSLFALHALGIKSFDSHLSLKPHGEDIAKKCGGLPLALITLETSLRTKEDEDSWKGVLESEIWNLPVEDEILPALRLSYHSWQRLLGCLAKLPNNFLKLKNLPHLDIRKTPCLDQMPLGIGELKSLQTLSKIIIGGKSGLKITKLKDLENLGGEVSIEDLDKMQNATDARVVRFPQKKLSNLKLQSLKELLIDDLDGVKIVGMEVLGTCHAFRTLEILILKECMGGRNGQSIMGKMAQCVVWRGVIDHLGAVEELSIKSCNEIRYLWESKAVASKVLVNLRGLYVRGCHNLVSLGDKDYDEDSNLQIASRRIDSIENLRVNTCSSITSIEAEGGGLKSLKILGCNKLLEREWGGQNNNN
ncbi:hypothetical protein E3N88_07967 [Mikania micrantha]|uniref:NB-ARC domain-containing protein n=1 Tax=Mikania micrantha TaxID=192012 RepID=A0A5N6PFC4_9ASTR|nr:hypothetical protein E3N88_07967 [Mikania micrantha]